MKEIKCPHCGQVFQVDESEYASILAQVKEEEINKQIHIELERQQALFNANKINEENKLKEKYQQEIYSLSNKINELNIMELNKCKRCGAFFTSSDSVCPNCKSKDLGDLSKLKNYLAENELPSSLDVLSYETGISVKNLNRFLDSNDIDFKKVNL